MQALRTTVEYIEDMAAGFGLGTGQGAPAADTAAAAAQTVQGRVMNEVLSPGDVRPDWLRLSSIAGLLLVILAGALLQLRTSRSMDLK